MPRRLSIRPPVAYDGSMNRGGFSLARLLGVSAAKARLSRQIGIPLTSSGRDAKVGRLVTRALTGGCLLPLLLALSLPAALIVAAAW